MMLLVISLRANRATKEFYNADEGEHKRTIRELPRIRQSIYSYSTHAHAHGIDKTLNLNMESASPSLCCDSDRTIAVLVDWLNSAIVMVHINELLGST